MLNLIIPGKPIHKKRPRFTTRSGFVRTYNSQHKEEETVRRHLREQYRGQPITVAIKVDIIFKMPRPKSHYGTGKNSSILKKKAPQYHTVVPDEDNLKKFIYDCMNKIIWRDDSLVVESHCIKRYGEKPETVISIIPL